MNAETYVEILKPCSQYDARVMLRPVAVLRHILNSLR